MAEVKYPFCFYAEYEDGRSRYIGGNSEEECICSIVHYEPKHGKCTYYTGVNDDDYVDGEYVGAENFVYEQMEEDFILAAIRGNYHGRNKRNL